MIEYGLWLKKERKIINFIYYQIVIKVRSNVTHGTTKSFVNKIHHIV